MARPSKLTPEVRDRVLAAIRGGSYAEQAAAMAGVHRATYYRWLDRGETESSGPYREFRDALRQSEAEAEVGAVAVIRKAGFDTWQAAAWWLERRFPNRWGRRDQVDVDLFLRNGAERLARERGIDPDLILEEAERFLRESR